MSNEKDWLNWGLKHDWVAPVPASKWKRLPVIRRIRSVYAHFKVYQHYTSSIGIIGIPTGYDDWILVGIQKGYV